jgi:3-oxoacyl-[acyl-carrier protein] reductase
MRAEAGDWVVVAGGGGALGREFVRYYASEGRPVLSLDCADPHPAEASGARIQRRAVDLTSPAEVTAALTDAVPRSDRIALLVNAVGLIWNEPVLSLRGASFQPHDIGSWRRVLDANLTAAFVIASHVAARMVRRGGGAIVNFSSITARGNTGQAAYSAAKAGIDGMTRTMAAELGPFGVRVNAVAPGFIDVASTRDALREEQLTVIARDTPLRRLGKVDEVIDAVRFLADNDFVTGVVLDVNGGLRL